MWCSHRKISFLKIFMESKNNTSAARVVFILKKEGQLNPGEMEIGLFGDV